MPFVRALETLWQWSVAQSRRARFRAREHAYAHLGLGWCVVEDDDELSKLDELPDFPEVPAEMLEARAWSLVASHPWNEFEHLTVPAARA